MKQTDDNVERMLWLLEHKEDATEEEIRDLMEDDECRDIYELIVLTDESYRIDEPASQDGWFRKAAAAVVIVLLTGVAVAAINHFASSSQTDLSDYACVMDERVIEAIGDTVVMTVADDDADVYVFNNRELRDILAIVAQHYEVEQVAFRSEPLMHLRLYFQWNQDESLDDCIDALNHFEKISVQFEDDVLLIDSKQEKEQQP